MSLEDLRPYATTQRAIEVLESVIKHGSNTKAAKALGCNRRAVDKHILRIKSKAIKQGYSPDHSMTRPVPDGFNVKGVSTYYDEDGNVRGQWVKSQADPAYREELIRQAIESISEEIPRTSPIKPPKQTIDDLLNQYTITDFHLGMMAWHEETGEDWDVKIAEDLLYNWFCTAVKLSPDAKVGVFCQLGDFMHWDGLDAVTPANKNLLDADTRFQKIVRVAIRVFRRIIQMMIEKHEIVYVIMAEGNHDPASSIWLREMFYALYEDEPRVIVDINPDVYYCYEHGLTSLFYHHGHKKKPTNIDDVFVAKYREVFGRTKYSYGHMGHMHHDHAIESNLMKIEQHRTLCAPDAFSSRGGWISGRDAKVITYSKQYGEVGRLTISPEMCNG